MWQSRPRANPGERLARSPELRPSADFSRIFFVSGRAQKGLEKRKRMMTTLHSLVWFLIAVVPLGTVWAADDPFAAELYSKHCAQCHDKGADARVPPRTALEKLTPGAVLRALETGSCARWVRSLRVPNVRRSLRSWVRQKRRSWISSRTVALTGAGVVCEAQLERVEREH
jgi:hypothetical protein